MSNKRKVTWIDLVVAGVVVLLVAIAWQPGLQRPTDTVTPLNRMNARQVFLGLLACSMDHDHKFPPGSLEKALYPTYIDRKEPFHWIHPETREELPWLYNPGLFTGSDSRTPLLAQPVPHKGKRIVVDVGGTIIQEPDDGTFEWPPKPAEPPPAEP